MHPAPSPTAALQACITGIGAITPFAVGWQDIAALAERGEAHYAPWSAELMPPFDGARLGVVKAYPKERYFNDRQLRLMDKSMSLNTVAAAFALEDAGLLVGDTVADHDDVATILSSSQGEVASMYRFGSPIFQTKPGSVNPAHFPMMARNVACGQLAIRFGLRGWSTMIAAGDASGAHALARAVDMVTSGRTHTVLVGAYEVLSQVSLHQWRVRAQQQAQVGAALDPASAEWVPAEGACHFVVESTAHAAARGRTPYVRIDHTGHGVSQGARGQGWPALIDRFLNRSAQPGTQPRAVHASCTSDSDGDLAHRHASAHFHDALARMCPALHELRTRPQFGNARSVNPMYAVAMAARHLAAAPGNGEALVSTLTPRGGYALFGLQRA